VPIVDFRIDGLDHDAVVVLGTLDRHVAVNDVLQDLRWIALKWVSKTTASSRGTLKAVAWNHRNA
jgi:hypothetical protein